MTVDSDEAIARRHGYRLVGSRRGWRIQGPREHARSRIDGEFYANANEAWRQAALRIARALASRRATAGRRRGWRQGEL